MRVESGEWHYFGAGQKGFANYAVFNESTSMKNIILTQTAWQLVPKAFFHKLHPFEHWKEWYLLITKNWSK